GAALAYDWMYDAFDEDSKSFAGKSVELYSVTESGKKILEGTAEVTTDSVLRFEASHTSLMFITEAGSAQGSSIWLWIAIAAALAAAAVIVFILYKKGYAFQKA
ncbi:MAG: hypothetical protein IIX89_00385, partial [Oscillospiraceae bacterium]|nr:hypothetical protein [Oscillospiraceae bacterium]